MQEMQFSVMTKSAVTPRQSVHTKSRNIIQKYETVSLPRSSTRKYEGIKQNREGKLQDAELQCRRIS